MSSYNLVSKTLKGACRKLRVNRIKIKNFRGIEAATIVLPKHTVLIGDNNTGKTTILEALDLALGPDRLNRFPPIDEHDFYQGRYLAKAPNGRGQVAEDQPIPVDSGWSEVTEPAGDGPAEAFRIEVEVAIVDLSEEQKARFGYYVEFWDAKADRFYNEPDPKGIDPDHITEALRVTFQGWYDADEDDFQGKTYFTQSLNKGDTPDEFRKKDKEICGFLYLRSLRTGNRALSLERGSLLDIILRLKEVRPQMWEDTIDKLADFTVAADPELGISGILVSINAALERYIPKEWGVEPHLKVSKLTREHLRKVITAFIATGDGNHAAPFYRQGTGTINMLVLAMLSQIAVDKQNVIFAMEEPETAIPPYAQKRIVHEIRSLASQAIFTSHSPYVLEEFTMDETVVLSRNANGKLCRKFINLPRNLKPKAYRQGFRTRFCEGLLSRRVLIAEGETETIAFPVVCRRLAELNPSKYKSLEALGICTLNAGGDSKVAEMAKFFKGLGKLTFAICDKQDVKVQNSIKAEVDLLLMHEKKGIESLVIQGTTDTALQRFASALEWPLHLSQKYPDPVANAHDALSEYFSWAKGNLGLADFLAQCTEDETPEWLRNACRNLKQVCEPTQAEDEVVALTTAEFELGAATDEADC